jgi:hypothetical protein
MNEWPYIALMIAVVLWVIADLILEGIENDSSEKEEK